MCGGKCVVDVEVAEARQRGDELRRVLFFSTMKAGVFEQQHVAGLHRRNRSFRLRPDAVAGERHRHLKRLRECRCDRLQRLLLVAALGAAEMREENCLAAFLSDLADRLRGGTQARVIADAAILHRHVEIDADEDAFSANVGVIKVAERAHSALPRTRVNSGGKSRTKPSSSTTNSPTKAPSTAS
jgi:hypothetical protein